MIKILKADCRKPIAKKIFKIKNAGSFQYFRGALDRPGALLADDFFLILSNLFTFN